MSYDSYTVRNSGHYGDCGIRVIFTRGPAMTTKNILILCLVVAAISAAVTRYYFPQLQTKTVEVTKEVVKTDVQTVTHTVTLPNGSTDTTTTTTDHSVKSETDNKTATVVAVKNWLIGATVNSDYKFEAPYYGLHAERRILGPLFLGALLTTKGDVGLSLGLEF